MKKPDYFFNKFTLLAWVSLLFFIFFCVHQRVMDNSKERALDILIFISSYFWGSANHKKEQSTSVHSVEEQSK